MCSTQIWLDRREDIWTTKLVSWRVSVGSCWILLEVIWNGVLLSCWVGDTFIGRLIWYYFSSMEWWESMHGAFRLDSWDEVEILQLILEFGKRCLRGRQTQFESSVISRNQLYVRRRFVWRNRFRLLAKPRIVCWFRRDRVSISFGALKPRSCVDFAEWYIRVRWSSAQIWKIFTEVENYGGDRRWSLLKLVESNLDSDFVFENESNPIGVS